MSKATERSSTTPSRRAFLTGAAPVAALVLAGGAAAVDAAVTEVITPSAAPTPDPIFALIEQHLAAIDEEERTAKIFGQHADEKEDHDNRGVVVGEQPMRSMVKIVHQGEEAWTYRDVMRPIVVFIPKMIPGYAPKDLGEAERAAWIKDKTNELRRNRRAYDKRNKNTPRDVAYNAWNEAGKVTDGLSKEIIETAPTTMAGVAAVLAHWSNVMNEEDHDRDFISTTEFLESLAKGVKAIG
jgi:hypothetical protein